MSLREEPNGEVGPEQGLCSQWATGTVGSPTGLRWEGEQAQAEPPSHTESSKHTAGVRRGRGRAGICKQRNCQGDPEEAAEVIVAMEGQVVGCREPQAFCPCGVIHVAKA